MRWIEFIYNQYLDDLKKNKMINEIEVNKDDLKILNNIPKTNHIKSQTHNTKIGDIFMLANLFFVISDIEEYPYEVFISSPYFELACEKDLIVESQNGKIWVMESITRYVTDELLENAIKVDSIHQESIAIMQNYIKGKSELPKDKIGLKYAKNNDSYQHLFRENQRRISLFLTIESINKNDLDIPETIEIDLNNSQQKKEFYQSESNRLSASSFEDFILTQFGEIIKKDNILKINFNNKTAGLIARLYLNKEIIYEGILPKNLKIKSNIKHAEYIKDNLEIEFL
jgi:hypothetical protein